MPTIIPNWKLRKGVISSALFILSFLCLYWVAGDVLNISGDEGIYLQGGRLVALGQQPYRDFFTITGPLSFWIEGVLAFCSGMSLAVMRLPPIFDAAFLAAAVYYLTSRYTGVWYSAITSTGFLAYEVRLRQLNVNHRWDSAALAMGAILLARRATIGKSRWCAAACGFLAVAAACATPSMLVLVVPLLLWCGWRDVRRAVALSAGAVVAGAIAAAYLQSQHALLPMIHAMVWTGANYTQANKVFYGGIPMGIETDWLGKLGLAFSLLPAIIPPVAILGWALYFRHRRKPEDSAEIIPLLAVTAALVLSTWPRWSSDALLHTLSLSWFLCALLLYRLADEWQQRLPLQGNWRVSVGALVLLAAFTSLGGKVSSAMAYERRETRVGSVRAPFEESEFLDGLERTIQPGDSLFSYPYLPSAYYFLDARNPTYYSFMQPGMMSLEDQRRAIAELQAAPPRWVIYEDFPPEAVLAIWPGSDPARLTMLEVNSYLHANYHPVDTVIGKWGRLVVMQNNAVAAVP
jgi:hypothetical protein